MPTSPSPRAAHSHTAVDGYHFSGLGVTASSRIPATGDSPAPSDAPWRRVVPSEERLNPLPRAGDHLLPGHEGADEHRPIERLADHEVRELRGGAVLVLHAQEAAP